MFRRAMTDFHSFRLHSPCGMFMTPKSPFPWVERLFRCLENMGIYFLTISLIGIIIRELTINYLDELDNNKLKGFE